jgi:hypothetical protein
MNASMCAALSSNPRKRGHAGQHEDDACGKHDEGREMGDHGFVSTKQKASSRREDVAAAGVETTPGARSFAIRLDLEAE